MDSVIIPTITQITLTQIIIAILFNSFICGSFTCYLAMLKDYSPTAWFFIGFFFGLFGLITAVGLPLKKDIIPDYKPSEKYLENITDK
jgi:hypothetical protein